MEHAEGRSRGEYFAIRRRELEEAFQEFSYCVDWLQTHDIDGKRSAHYLKDRVQTDCRPPHTLYFYIPRGAFILAALHSGLTVRKMDGSADAWISDPDPHPKQMGPGVMP